MKICAKVKPSASRNEIKKRADGTYEIFVTAAPEKGKANKAVIDLLADMFEVKRSSVRIVKGATFRNKVIEISKL